MDNPLRSFSLMLEAWPNSSPRSKRLRPNPCLFAPSLADSLSELGPLPREALLLGPGLRRTASPAQPVRPASWSAAGHR